MRTMQDAPTTGPVVNRKTMLDGKVVYYMDRHRAGQSIRSGQVVLCSEREMFLFRNSVAQRLRNARAALGRM